MSRDHRSGIPALASAVIVAAVLIPLGASLWTKSAPQGGSQAQLAAQTVLNRAEIMLSAAVRQGERVRDMTRGQCTPDSVALMGQILFDAADIEEIGIFQNGAMRCTSFGIEEPPLTLAADRAVLPENGVVVLPPAVNSTLLEINLRVGTDTGVKMMVPAERIFAIFDGGALPSTVSVALTTSSGQELARHGAGESGARSTATSSRFPIAATATDSGAPAADVTASMGWLAPAAVVGLLLGLGALYLTRRHISPAARLAMGIRKGELVVHYLPLIDIQKNRCVGAECLVRWQHPTQGLIKPALFIPLAEDAALITPLTEAVMRRTIADLGELMAADGELRLSINISAAHFKDTALVDAVKRIYEGSKIPLKQLAFEVSEHGLVEDADHKPREVTTLLKALGAETGVDDFGTGQATPQYLKSFELDVLKIDRPFIGAIGTKAVLAGAVDGIIDMARQLKLRIVAEGVENATQLAYLKTKGVEGAQGHHFSPPLTASAFAAFVKKFNASASGGS